MRSSHAIGRVLVVLCVAVALGAAAPDDPRLIDAAKSGNAAALATLLRQRAPVDATEAGRLDGAALGGAARPRGHGAGPAPRQGAGQRRQSLRRHAADPGSDQRQRTGGRSAAEGGCRSEHDGPRRRDRVDARGAYRSARGGAVAHRERRKRQRQRNVAGRDGIDVGGGRGPSRGRRAAGEERRGSERTLEDT